MSLYGFFVIKKVINMTDVLKKCVLFNGLNENEIEAVLGCVSSQKKKFDEGNIIYHQGDIIDEIGIVIEGSVSVVKEDFWGNRSIISIIPKGAIFGEVYASLETKPMDNTVYAAEKSEILFMNISKILDTCSNSCQFHKNLVHNMVRVLAGKNIMLMEKISHISKKTTREKVLSFLSAEAKKSGSAYFEIPFSRQEMAEYLSVDRSALSKELGKMRDEKIIDFDRNNFRILKK